MKTLSEIMESFCKDRLKATFILTFVIETITLLFRFGFGLKSTESTASTVGKLTFGIRIHHGYIGLLMLLLVAIFPAFRRSRFSDSTIVIGASLLVSDIIHHSILYFVTGSADFDLVYPVN
jgi:hypothetical protein